MSEHEANLLDLVDRLGLIRARDIARAGIPTVYLTRLVRSGELERIARGLYTRRAAPQHEHTTLLEVTKQVPKGVVCLLSALRFYDLGTQRPHHVWLALPAHASTPTSANARLEIVRMSGPSLGAGVRYESVAGGTLRIFEPSKTIADLFKFRNRVGLDVAIEALQAYWRSPLRDITALHHYSRIDRVEKVMRPYLEAVAS